MKNIITATLLAITASTSYASTPCVDYANNAAYVMEHRQAGWIKKDVQDKLMQESRDTNEFSILLALTDLAYGLPRYDSAAGITGVIDGFTLAAMQECVNYVGGVK